mmetsp:Transcript_9808/g.18628  ORF Transcript_9808/g.18628 Transcript_9808/m.18628 type:complete len:80 (+) Transcript_9808:919-1158(+)
MIKGETREKGTGGGEESHGGRCSDERDGGKKSHSAEVVRVKGGHRLQRLLVLDILLQSMCPTLRFSGASVMGALLCGWK